MGGKKIVHCVLVLFVQIRWAGFLKIVHCTLCASTICTNKVGGFSKKCTLCACTTVYVLIRWADFLKIVHCVLVLFVQIRWADFLKIVHCVLALFVQIRCADFLKIVHCVHCASTICTNKVGGFSNFFITVGQKCIVTTKCIKKLNTKLQLLFKKN